MVAATEDMVEDLAVMEWEVACMEAMEVMEVVMEWEWAACTEVWG